MRTRTNSVKVTRKPIRSPVQRFLRRQVSRMMVDLRKSSNSSMYATRPCTHRTHAFDSRPLAGIQAAEAMAQAGVATLLTGYVGPKAFQALQAAGVQVIQDLVAPAGDAALQKTYRCVRPS